MSLYLLYVVGINVFLSTSLFDRVVNGDPVTLDIHYARGWSLFPGTIHAEHLSIRSSDSNVEWILKLDEVEFDLDFPALARRAFLVKRTHGKGISLRARQKLMKRPDTTEEIANLPPIPGFPAFSVRPADPHHPELWDDDQYELITAGIEDATAEDVREIWIDDARFSGHARVTGRFFLKPLRRVEIGKIDVAIESGQIDLGHDRPVVAAIAGKADVFAKPFDPRAVDGADVLRHFTIHTDLRGRSAELATFPIALPAGVYATGTIEARRVALSLEEGRLAAGTVVEAGAERVFVAKNGHFAEGALDLRAAIAHETDRDRLRAELHLQHTRLLRSDTTELLHAGELWLRGDSAALDLAEDGTLQDGHLALELPEATLPDLRVANCMLPCALFVHSGRATLAAQVELWPQAKRVAASTHLRYAGVHASSDAFDAESDGELRLSFGSARWDDGSIEGVSLLADVRDAVVTAGALRRGALHDAVIGVRAARIDANDPLAALDATITIAEGSGVELDVGAGGAAGKIAGDAHVSIEKRALAGFDARVRAPDLRARYGELRGRASVEASASSIEGVSSAKLRLAGVATDGGGVRADRARVAIRSSGGALDLALHVDGGRVEDASALRSLLPSSVAIATDDGRFDGGASIAVRGDVVRARVAMVTKGLGVHTPKVSAIADADVDVDVRRYDGETLSLGPSRVALTNVRSSLGRARTIEVDGVARDLDLEHPNLEVVDAHVALAGVTVPDARALQALVSPRSKVRITSGALRANGDVTFAGKDGASGAIAIDAQHAGLAIEQSSLEADLALRVKVAGVDARAATMDVSGTHLALRDVEVKNAAAETRGWSGDVVLDAALLGWGGGVPSFGADVALTADDARPVVGMLLRDHAPKFVGGLLTMPNLALRGRLDADPDEIALTDFYVHGGDVALRGSYAVRDGHERGAFVVSKSGVAVGLRVGDDGAHPRFFGLDRWLREEEGRVKAKH
ncbi:MAG: hypothetical protein KIT84_20360 [Labilithrix sp.]|nr:hypothetical protein [Labilithrix sp.]MCW5813393.1 hypothetical protein [Labilithrix sp.]